MAACSEDMLSDRVKQSSARRYAGLNVDSPALVVGLGKTGYSCARFLESQGVSVIVTDDRARPPEMSLLRHEFPDVPVFAGGFSPEALESCAQVVISPGVPLREPVKLRSPWPPQGPAHRGRRSAPGATARSRRRLMRG